MSVTVTRPGRARSVSRFAHDGVRTVNALRSLVPSARYPTASKSRVRREHFHGVSAVIAYSCPCSGSTDAFTSAASATTRPRSLITARVTDGSPRAISRTVPADVHAVGDQREVRLRRRRRTASASRTPAA